MATWRGPRATPATGSTRGPTRSSRGSTNQRPPPGNEPAQLDQPNHRTSRRPSMSSVPPALSTELDDVLVDAVARRVAPGFAGLVTDRDGTIYEGAAGRLAIDQARA